MKKNLFSLVMVSLLITGLANNVTAASFDVKVDGSTLTAPLDVSPTGTLSKEAFKVSGTDQNNAFQLKVMGHAGGTVHSQITTDATNGRLTVMASTADDNAPRFSLIGPNDEAASAISGWAIVDYGSKNIDLPDSKFKVRNYRPGVYTDMLTSIGNHTVSVPTANVGIGTTSPAAVLDVSPSGTISTEAVKISGTDQHNAFQVKVMGHGGGTAHSQITTDATNGRLTVMASTADDSAPRFSLIGPNDEHAPHVSGWAIVDYGSRLQDLPDAQFKIRYTKAGGSNFLTDMLTTIGNHTVSVPTANFGIGTTTPGSKLSVAGLPTSPPDVSGNQGVVCITNDGNMWVDDDGTNDCV